MADGWRSRRPTAATVPGSDPRPAATVRIAGIDLEPTGCGGLWWAEHRLLAVADLHLEKGSSFASSGQFLPPYDTADTLAALGRLIALLEPRIVVALGDSFHDGSGWARLSPTDRDHLGRLQGGREWVWIAGNHDPEGPVGLAGASLPELAIGPLVFRHEPRPGEALGEIAGHLHPAARVSGRAGSVRRRCFVGDGSRLVLPAFGVLAGGLNVLDRAFGPLFAGRAFQTWMLGRTGIFPVRTRALRPD